VRLGTRVDHVDAEGIRANGVALPSAAVIWAAGVRASPAARWLGVEPDGLGRVPVRGDYSVPDLTNVFVIGDTAACTGSDGKQVPGVAPAAKQGGHYVARVIAARLLGRARRRRSVIATTAISRRSAASAPSPTSPGSG
jgi:NADH dehydrogenase FAD-containing subunit